MYKTIYVYRNGAFLFNISAVHSVEIMISAGVPILKVDGVHLGLAPGFRFVVETWGSGC